MFFKISPLTKECVMAKSKSSPSSLVLIIALSLLAVLTACKPVEKPATPSEKPKSETATVAEESAAVPAAPQVQSVKSVIFRLDEGPGEEPEPGTDGTAIVLSPNTPPEIILDRLDAERLDWERIKRYEMPGWRIRALRNIGDQQIIIETEKVTEPQIRKNYLMVVNENEWVIVGVASQH